MDAQKKSLCIIILLLAFIVAIQVDGVPHAAFRPSKKEQSSDHQKKGSERSAVEVDIDDMARTTTFNVDEFDSNKMDIDALILHEDFLEAMKDANVSKNDVLSLRAIILGLASVSPGDNSTIYPLCQIFRIGARKRLHCLIVGLIMRYLVAKPVDLRGLMGEKQALPVGGVGYQQDRPVHRLEDIGEVPDFVTDQQLIDREKPVYYWYFRQILNMFSYCLRWNKVRKEKPGQEDMIPPPLLPSATGSGGYYSQQKLYYLEGPADMRYRRPFAQSFVFQPQQQEEASSPSKELIFIFRGTIYSPEWAANYRATHVPQEEVAALKMHGLIPKGMFGFFKELLEPIKAEIARTGAKKIFLAGHSLGGSIAKLLAMYLDHEEEEFELTVLTFGAPNFGDRETLEHFSRFINIRQLNFVGSGLLKEEDGGEGRRSAYGIGDMLPQLPPDCVAVSPCPILTYMGGKGNGIDLTDLFNEYKMERAPGVIVFRACDLLNASGWYYYEDFVAYPDRIDRGAPASHVCSYQCYLAAAVGDPDTRCYFPGDDNDDDQQPPLNGQQQQPSSSSSNRRRREEEICNIQLSSRDTDLPSPSSTNEMKQMMMFP